MAGRVERLIDAANDGAEAFVESMKLANERAYRFSKLAVDEFQRTQSEQFDLARRWARSPTDVIRLANETLATVTRRQRRRMELGRTFFDEMTTARNETAEAVQRVVSANREAVGVGVDASRDGLGRATDELSERAEDVSDAAAGVGRNLRRRANAN